jgi:AAA lid domain
MDLQEFVDHIPNLTDLELAVLLSLIARQHCLVYTDDTLVDALSSELALIVSETFKLSYVVLTAQDCQSMDTFGDAILDENHNFASESDFESENDAIAGLKSQIRNVSFKGSRSSQVEQTLDSRMIVNVIIAKDLNQACHDVQIQIMELILNRRIFSRTTVHHVPKTFFFLPIIANSSKHVRLNHHLNDRIFMSHTHSAEDGFPNLEEIEEMKDLQVRPSLSYTTTTSSFIPSVKRDVIDQLRTLGQAANMTSEIRRYLQDIVVFLRLERGVDGGVTPFGNVCFVELAKYLAPLHGLDFVTPSLVGLAARKVFPHRITMATAERERSIQFGSNIEAVKQYLDGLTPEVVIELVLAKVDSPL